MIKLLTIIFILILNEAAAQEEWYEYERIMLIKSKDNFILEEGLLTYKKDNKWYLPLEDLFSAIGVEYNIGQNQRIIEGFLFKEENSYRIDLNKCELIFSSQTKKIDCTSFIALEEFILVDIETLEKITPIKFMVNSLNSSIVLKYDLLFPPEESKKRASKQSGRRRYAIEYPVERSSREWIDGLNFDQSITLESQKSSTGITRKSVRHESSLSAEVLKSELYTDYRGFDDKQESFWLSLERNDYRGRIFGDLGLSEIKAVNFNAPNVRLVGGGKKLTGGYFSNRSLEKPVNFSKEDFSGPLESGWEVELYQNDILIGRQSGTALKQRYEFSGVDLFYGANRFQFVFYGPKGERRYETKNLNIKDTFGSDEKVTVTGAIGQDESDKENYTFSLSKSLFKKVQLDLSTTRSFDERTEKSTDYYGGSISTFLDSTLIDTSYITDGVNRAVETSIKLNVLGVNSNLSYINNTGVESDYLGQGNPIDYSWSGYFLVPLRFVNNLQMYNSFKYRKNIGVETKSLDLLSRLSFSIRNLYISNSVSIENEEVFNEFFTRYTLGRSTLKLKNRVNRDGLRDSEFAYSFSNKKKHSYSSSIMYEFEPKTTTIRLRADRKFENFYAGITTEVSSKSEYGIGLNLTYGLVYDENVGVNLYNKRTSEYANIKALAFFDRNGDGLRSDNEELLKDIDFYRLSGNEKQSSDRFGYAFFSFVQPLTPTDIKISLQNIENIYLRSSTPGKRVWGRAGKTAVVEFPLRIEGDIEGEVEFLKSSGPKEKIKGEILVGKKLFKEITIERDGYFYSQGILPGKYTLKIKCETCTSKEYRRDFTMPKEGDSIFLEGVRI